MKITSNARHVKKSAVLATLTKTVQHARQMRPANLNTSLIAGVTVSVRTLTTRTHPTNADHAIQIARLVVEVLLPAQAANRTVTSLFFQSPSV